MLGYCYLIPGKAEPAIAAFRKYVELAPNEPNAHDSLAEALMAGGQFEEAETTFRKAIELSPSFFPAWQGVAFTKFYRGDWKAGEEALGKAREASMRTGDKLGADEIAAWAHFAQGHSEEALKTVAAMKASAESEKLNGLWVASVIDRAVMLVEAGRYQDAVSEVSAGMERVEKAPITGGARSQLQRNGWPIQIIALLKLGKKAEAEKTLALLDAEARTAPSTAQLQSRLHFAEGAIALAGGDSKGAAAHFSQCLYEDFFCHWYQVREKAGDAAAIQTARDKLRSTYRRDPIYLYVRTKLEKG